MLRLHTFNDNELTIWYQVMDRMPKTFLQLQWFNFIPIHKNSITSQPVQGGGGGWGGGLNNSVVNTQKINNLRFILIIRAGAVGISFFKFSSASLNNLNSSTLITARVSCSAFDLDQGGGGICDSWMNYLIRKSQSKYQT